MNKAISISLAKVDYDLGQPYIKIIADNPQGYQFTQCIIEVHPIIDGEWGEIKRFDISSLLEGREDINMTLPVSALEGASSPAIYDIYLQAEHLDPNTPDEAIPLEIRLMLSDIHGVYRYIMDGLLNTDKCSGVPDDLIKKYLLLYGHQAALEAKHLGIAKDYFKLMHQGFSKCGRTNNSINCGCHDRR